MAVEQCAAIANRVRLALDRYDKVGQLAEQIRVVVSDFRLT